MTIRTYIRHSRLHITTSIIFFLALAYFISPGLSGIFNSIIHLVTSMKTELNHRDIEQLLNSNITAMDDSQLVDIVRENWIYPPSNLPYSLTDLDKEDYSQLGESRHLDKLMNGKKEGFYIECGAYDGEIFSVSLFFEKVRRWNGLLVEANPLLFAKLESKNRKAYTSNSCLSVVKNPERVRFQNARGLGGIENFLSRAHQNRLDREQVRGEVVEVQCFPLYTMLLALGLPTVDLFVLDVEGAEADILKTIPFDKVKISFVYVEHNYVEKERQNILNVMTNNSYEYVGEYKYNSIYRLKSLRRLLVQN